MRLTQTKTIQYRNPVKGDGRNVWELVRSAGTLDVNSAYCYLMLCDYFRETCVLAERDGKLAGFVSAFRPSGREDSLFVWQIAVASEFRGQGIGFKLLMKLIKLPASRCVRYVETTISPSNTASWRLFSSFAKRCGAGYEKREGYATECFPTGHDHEEECLYRIGPIKTESL